MRYKSTRNSNLRFSAAQVITKGISEEGGLFVPESFPDVRSDLSQWAQMDYCTLAERILALYLTDFTAQEIQQCVHGAYSGNKFEGNQPVQVRHLDDDTAVLELWHGPTCAFKDMALQLLPQLLSVSMKKTAEGKTAMILVATSGDTGKAALEGFKDVPLTKIISFYPKNGVSDMQRLQMVTQDGANVQVCAVAGNFDDTQTGVKTVFTDPEIRARAESADLFFSSANSINFGRLLPQIVYYFYAYFEMYRSGKITSLTEPINVAVPTGNFGNILAGYYARRMGLPVHKFICASNANHVLTEFINTGHYDKRRNFYTTMSPSMDILVSSNLERLLYHLCGEESVALSNWMQGLAQDGEYQVNEATAREVKRLFYGEYCTDEKTRETIGEIFRDRQYLCDTHTAVALNVYKKYVNECADHTKAVIVSTASPYKFSDYVLQGLKQPVNGDPFAQLSALETYTGCPAQSQLKDLRSKKIRFNDAIEPAEMKDYVSQWITRWGAES